MAAPSPTCRWQRPRPGKDRTTGERRERTEWHRVVIFAEGLAKVAEQYLK
jgi:single-stranded DNA-binding protein